MRPTARTFEVELDRKRQLQYNLLAQFRFEEATGVNMAAALKPLLSFMKQGADVDLVGDVLSKISPRHVAALVWCALGRYDDEKPWRWIPDDDLTLEDVAGMLTVEKLGEIFGTIIGASAEAADDKAEARPPEAQPVEQTG